MDPPERWSGADRYGTTPYEQAHPRGLTDRLAEEEPDVTGAAADPTARAAAEFDQVDEQPGERPATDDAGIAAEELREARDRGQLADDAGGSLAATARTADEPD